VGKEEKKKDKRKEEGDCVREEEIFHLGGDAHRWRLGKTGEGQKKKGKPGGKRKTVAPSDCTR